MKRKNGLMKKAMELSVLCGAEAALVLFDERGRLFLYGTTSAAATLARHAKGTVVATQHRNNAEARAHAACVARMRPCVLRIRLRDG